MTNEVITYDRLELDLPVSLNSIKEFRLEQQLNEHNRLRITGTLKESEQDFALDQLSMESEATIVLDGKPLFCGVVTKCLQKRVNDVSEIELTFADHSILLDIRKRNRSFQDVTVAYRDSMKRIAKEYDGSLAALGYEEIKPSVPLIQYQETDWVFLKRLASQLGTYLLPDCKSHRANIYLGAHMGYQHEEEMIHYKIEKEYGNYLSLNASSKKQVTNEYVTYIVEMEGNYEMGDKISSQGEVYTIIEKVTELKRNTIHFTYRLQLEATIQLPILYNEAMKGMSIEGTVISQEGDKLKLHLSIDEEQKESEAYAYSFATPYTASGNTGFYFMPQKGERVKLYIPTREEGNAYVTNTIRLDGEDNPFTEDPIGKYIGTSEDKLFLMKQDEFTINAEKNELYIRMTDDDGISIISNKDMKIVSGRKIELHGKTFEVVSGKRIILATKKTSIVIDSLININGGVGSKASGGMSKSSNSGRGQSKSSHVMAEVSMAKAMNVSTSASIAKGNILLSDVTIVDSTDEMKKSINNSPYLLKMGNRKTVKSNNYWFSFSAKGEVDISIMSSSDSTVTVYKKELFGKTKVCTKTGKSFLLQYSLYTNETYIINVISNETYIIKPGSPIPTASISCSVAYHQDVKYSSTGGHWEADADSPYPGNVTTGLVYLHRYFIPKSDAQAFYDGITSDKYLTVMEYATKLTLTTVTTYIAYQLGFKTFLADLAYSIFTDGISIEFISIVESQMKKAGNYSSGIWNNGVQINVYLIPNGGQCEEFKPWTNTTMLGVSGYRGTWK